MSSLEESMNTLAEANLVLAKAMTGYAGVMQKYLDAGGGASAPAATEKTATDTTPPAKKTAAKKTNAAKAAPPADDGGFGDDGFGGEGEAEIDVPAKLTGDQVKAKLLEVRDAYGDKAPALKIINDLGYNAIPDVKPADFAAVWVACEKAIAAAS